MLVTCLLLRRGYGAALAFLLPHGLSLRLDPRPFRQRHGGAAPLERVLPGLDDLPGPAPSPGKVPEEAASRYAAAALFSTNRARLVFR
jgi:hypothetical protein